MEKNQTLKMDVLGLWDTREIVEPSCILMKCGYTNLMDSEISRLVTHSWNELFVWSSY